jgi:hypothetical protein
MEADWILTGEGEISDLTGRIRGMRSRVCQDWWVTDLAGCLDAFVAGYVSLFAAHLDNQAAIAIRSCSHLVGK